MSAKSRRVVNPNQNFAVPRKVLTEERAATVWADPSAMNESERLALTRALVIMWQLNRHPDGVPEPHATSTGKPGRPKSAAASKALAEYEFDTHHYQMFRDAGWGNVPPNKKALYALLDRMYPNDSSAKRENTLKVALKRERAVRSR